MFERFTERAREVIVVARETAEKRGRPRGGKSPVQTVDLLYALVHERLTDSLAHKILLTGNVTQTRMDGIRFGLPTEHDSDSNSHFSEEAQRTLELSLREALSLGNNYIGTEHILLALTRFGSTSAGRVLTEFSIDPDALRETIMRELRPPVKKKAEPEVKSAEEALTETPNRTALATRVRGLLDERLTAIETSEPEATRGVTRDDAEVISLLAASVAALEGPPQHVNWIGSAASRRAS
jgi:ATP-dependent Clp protease ATP-binding subunit ClpA